MNNGDKFDVVVIGAGLAGLVAGVRGAELGLRTAVLEKGETALYLCNTRVSGGIFHVAHLDIRQPREVMLAAIRDVTFDHADPALAETLASQAGPMMDWLLGLGAKFIRSGGQAGNPPMARRHRGRWRRISTG